MAARCPLFDAAHARGRLTGRHTQTVRLTPLLCVIHCQHPNLCLLEIPSEPVLQRLRESYRIDALSETGCDLNHKRPTPDRDRKTSETESSGDSVPAAAQRLVSRNQGRIRRRYVRSDDAGHRLLGWRRLFRRCDAEWGGSLGNPYRARDACGCVGSNRRTRTGRGADGAR
jgi:hypothetical protein